MAVGVSYWEADNYTKESINYNFIFFVGYLIEKTLQIEEEKVGNSRKNTEKWLSDVWSTSKHSHWEFCLD